MHKSPAIHVALIDASLRPALLDLNVLPRQRLHVGAIDNLLADADTCPGCEPMVILRGDAAIGFYRIDPHPRSVAGHDFEVPALGLRAFFIDADWQGQGLGTLALAALVADLAKRHRQARLLVLAVSAGNHPAVRLYRRAGFVDSGELYHHAGRSGPQLLLLRDLP